MPTGIELGILRSHPLNRLFFFTIPILLLITWIGLCGPLLGLARPFNSSASDMHSISLTEVRCPLMPGELTNLIGCRLGVPSAHTRAHHRTRSTQQTPNALLSCYTSSATEYSSLLAPFLLGSFDVRYTRSTSES